MKSVVAISQVAKTEAHLALIESEPRSRISTSQELNMTLKGNAPAMNYEESRVHKYKPKPLGYVPSLHDIDSVVRFLPMLEETPIDALFQREGDGVSSSGVFTIGRTVTDPRIDEFVRSLIDHGFIQPFEWMDWAQEARKYVENQELMAGADLVS